MTKTNRQNIKIVGRVTYGNGLGQKLGFPTANIEPSHPLPKVADGVWAGFAEVEGKPYESVINIGYSPSVVENGARRIEAHIVGFEGNLYGQEITLYLVYHLREERKFGSREELVAQIERDRNKALDLLSIKE